eukprot:CAMPEP_0113821126 /NCGR_PEP_ID=MMETSP0328-20130328/1582_1 /TAXON_ID=39455 /ORGANISM="Alexandrium minutum" /LENGTH=177 /DNA_ID=CAMNT_0000789057 /DNA_START=87 /DNA_END=620 /DNA_ORIENTATION=- /assembly_acc=CAM_ASM_000350
MVRRRASPLLVALIGTIPLWISCLAPTFVHPPPSRSTSTSAKVFGRRRVMETAVRAEKGSSEAGGNASNTATTTVEKVSSSTTEEKSEEGSPFQGPLLVLGGLVLVVVLLYVDNGFPGCVKSELTKNESPDAFVAADACFQVTSVLVVADLGLKFLLVFVTLKAFIASLSGAAPPSG